jgi:membrane protein DedA with SNARE-associated domain
VDALAEGLVGQYGYWGLAVGLVLNRLGVPFPTEVSLSLTGLAVHQGTWQFGPILIMVVLAQMIGLILAYLLVRVHWKRERGIARLIHSKRMKHLQRRVKGRESHMVFMALVVPGLHGVAGYGAGLAKMPFLKFTAVALAGVVVWTLVLMALGYFASSYLDEIFAVMRGLGVVVAVVAVTLGFIWYSRHHGK